jgi:membrane protein required for colicin V production
MIFVFCFFSHSSPSIFFILLSLLYFPYSLTMSFLDIVLGAFLLYALFTGENGLFIELASLISLIRNLYCNKMLLYD